MLRCDFHVEPVAAAMLGEDFSGAPSINASFGTILGHKMSFETRR